MSEIKIPDAPANPLADKLEEVGLREFERLVKSGEIPSLTNQFLKNYQFRAIVDTINRFHKDELIEVPVAKTNAEGKIVQKDGYVEFEKRMVFRRDHERKRLLQEHGLSEKDLKAWEIANS